MIFIEHPGAETYAALTGVISHSGMTDRNMKCAKDNQQEQKKDEQGKNKRNPDSALSNRKGRSATHLTTSLMVAKHVDWIKQVAMKGSCNPYENHGAIKEINIRIGRYRPKFLKSY